MGLFSRNTGADDEKEEREFDNRMDITKVLGQAREGDQFTLKTSNDLVLDFEVTRVEDRWLHGTCGTHGEYVARVSGGTLHEPVGGDRPGSVGYGITRLEIVEMASPPTLD